MSIRRFVVSGILTLLVVVAADTFVFPQVDTSGLTHACVNNGSGTIKVVASDADCSNNEILLAWYN